MAGRKLCAAAAACAVLAAARPARPRWLAPRAGRLRGGENEAPEARRLAGCEFGHEPAWLPFGESRMVFGDSSITHKFSSFNYLSSPSTSLLMRHRFSSSL